MKKLLTCILGATMVAGYSMAADTIRYMHYTGDSQWATTGNWSNQTTKLLMTNQLGTNDIARINKGSQGTPGALCQLFISTEVANVAVAVDEPGQLYMEGTESTPITLNAIGNSYNALGWNSRGTFTLTNYANFYATSSITIGRQGWWTNVTPIQVQSNKNVSCWASVGANCTLATTNNFIFNNQDQPYHVTNFGYSYFKATNPLVLNIFNGGKAEANTIQFNAASGSLQIEPGGSLRLNGDKRSSFPVYTTNVLAGGGTNWTYEVNTNIIVMTNYSGYMIQKTYDGTYTWFTAVPSNAPGQIQNFFADLSGQTVAMFWDADANGFSNNVYRSANISGPWTLLTTTTASDYTDMSPLLGVTSYYQIKGANDLGEGEASETKSVDVPLDAPINLQAMAGISSIDLTWDSVAGATGYNVKRSTTMGGSYTTISNNHSSTTYSDVSATPSVTYYYVVSAVQAGESANSAEVSAMIIGGTPPAVPTNVVATASSTQISLSWDASANATNYIVKRSTTMGGTYSNDTSTASTSLVAVGTSVGVTYYFVVSATGTGGESAASTEVSATIVSTNVVVPTTVSTNGTYNITTVGPEGQSCTLQVRTNLMSGTWSNSATGIIGPSGSYTFTNYVSNGNWFYRVVYP